MKYPSYPIDARNAGDKREMVYQRGMLIPVEIDLSTAMPLKEFGVKGDVIYIDRNATGEIGVKFDMAFPAFFPLAANSAIRGVPYEQLLLSWTAQPGATLRMWCGYGVDIVPPNQDITNIGNIDTLDTITNPVAISTVSGIVTVQGVHAVNGSLSAANQPVLTRNIGGRYDSTYNTTTSVTANNPDTVFSAGSNVNGAIVWSAHFAGYSSPGWTYPCYLANTTPPVNVNDGQVILLATSRMSTAGSDATQAALHTPMFIAPGRGLYYINAVNESAAQRGVLYSLL